MTEQLTTIPAALLALVRCPGRLGRRARSRRWPSTRSVTPWHPSSSSAFARDDDPELVRDAIPFALKTIESLIEQSPKHKGLLTAAASGFTQYGYAFIQQEADFIEAQDLDRGDAMRARAKKLYLRAVDYGLRGLEVDMPGLPRPAVQGPRRGAGQDHEEARPAALLDGRGVGGGVRGRRDRLRACRSARAPSRR